MSDLGETITEYLKLRLTIEQREEEHDIAMAELRSKFDAIGAILLDTCNTQNADSIKTPHGTITRSVRSRYWTSDWPSMYDFIRTNDAPFLLEQRIHNGNMKQFLEENPGTLPAGLNKESKYVVQVRKPTNK